jgi:polygalacturonase
MTASFLLFNQVHAALNITVPAGSDQNAINGAIDQVAAAGGGTVYLQNGTYKISGSIYMKPNVTLDGAGQGSTIIRPNKPRTSFHNVDASLDDYDNMTVKDLTVDSYNGSGIGVHYTTSNNTGDNNSIVNVEQMNSSSHGINGGGQNRLTMQNCYVHDSGGGGNTHNVYWRRWSYPSVTGNRSDNSAICGFKMSWGDHLTFSGNTCANNAAEGVITQHTSSQPVYDVSVMNCTFNNNGDGTELYGQNLKVDGCTARSNGRYGFYVNNYCGAGADGYIDNSTACYNPYDFDPHGCTGMSGNTTCQ